MKTKNESHRVKFDIRTQERQTLANHINVSKPILKADELAEELKGLVDVSDQIESFSLEQPAIGTFTAKHLEEIAKVYRDRGVR